MKFTYQKYRGEFTEYELVNWSEDGNYIQGVCVRSNAFKTFRKDRVSSYLDGSDTFLKAPYVTGDPRIPVRREQALKINRSEPPPPGVPQILFTGFPAAQREEMEAVATEAGLYVRKNGVTRDLTFLCIGPNAGPAKVKQARGQGTYIVPATHFNVLVETGELPDEE
ncbi:BRCT domain-containing protein [Burkholderia mayonis]|uniref:BRCT domain-containing protein n=1 Tax=Burkholderia mayonis TaxID=1385591 RepID=UPI0009E6D3E5|nr:BRCT domain-containing protein [Burkholderia mayonis]